MINRMMPSWLRDKEPELPRLDVPPLPTIASVPHPSPSDTGSPLNTATIMSKATTVLIQQIQDERRNFEKIQSQAVEVVFKHEQDQKKIAFLELENAELRNNIQTLSSQLEDFRKLYGTIRERLDLYDIRKAPAKPRKNGRKEIASCETPLPPLPEPSAPSSTLSSLSEFSSAASSLREEPSAVPSPTTRATGLGAPSTGGAAGIKDET